MMAIMLFALDHADAAAAPAPGGDAATFHENGAAIALAENSTS
jgi:hypothetical protein